MFTEIVAYKIGNTKQPLYDGKQSEKYIIWNLEMIHMLMTWLYHMSKR